MDISRWSIPLASLALRSDLCVALPAMKELRELNQCVRTAGSVTLLKPLNVLTRAHSLTPGREQPHQLRPGHVSGLKALGQGRAANDCTSLL
eukprot:6858779-Prymnesium_polylepis.3